MKTWLIFFCLTLSALSTAEVAPTQAQLLGTMLTPLGAERAGNAEGSIPEWDDGQYLAEKLLALKVTPSDHELLLVNPFAEEEPYLVITADNVDRHIRRLSAGQVAMLKWYPDTYSIQVYPTHRTFSNDQSIYAAARKNALTERLTNNGNGITGYELAYPFPMLHGTNAEMAIQVMWNHMSRWRTEAVQRNMVQITPTQQGLYTPVRLEEVFAFREVLGGANKNYDNNISFMFKQKILSPASLAGDILLVHETINQVSEPRRSWVYDHEQRRVKRTPTVAYDSTGTAADGLRTNDNYDMFNGSPNRYEWKLLGKKEVYIPYNNYELTNPALRYKDIVKPQHLNPEHLRYELHRVWIVEANLKPEEQHIYGKRVFYVDEDSWQIALVDHYDNEGNLWRAAEGFHVQYYDQKVAWLAAEAIYDLPARRYLVAGLANEEIDAFNWNMTVDAQDFMPAAIRREGR